MKLAIIFWCYQHVEIYITRLHLLRHYNPTAPIYVLFGGDPAAAPNFEAEFLPYINDFYCYPEQRKPLWKYWHGDMLISQWFTDRGHVLDWDSVTIIQWDMLSVPQSSAVPTRLSICRTCRQNTVSRIRPILCPRRHRHLARNRRAGSVRLLDWPARGGVRIVAQSADQT